MPSGGTGDSKRLRGIKGYLTLDDAPNSLIEGNAVALVPIVYHSDSGRRKLWEIYDRNGKPDFSSLLLVGSDDVLYISPGQLQSFWKQLQL